jgi:hypothetical protein
LKCDRIQSALHRALTAGASRNKQRRLGQAVAGVKRRGPETIRRESSGEPFERFRPNRLGAVEGDAPGGKIETLDRLRPEPVDAMVIAEIRAASDLDAMAREDLEPNQRALHEVNRAIK